MKIDLGTIEVSDEMRKAYRATHSNKPGLATRSDLRNWARGVIMTLLLEFVDETNEEPVARG